MRSDAVKLSQEDYEYIMHYKDAKSKPLDMLRKKYPMSYTYAVTSSLCKTEKIGRISEAKKETTPPVTSQETEDVLELHKRNQKDIEKIRASGRTLAFKLSVP
ncbi:11351_t:CDS:2 [Entrophospora sp. SA101]|nr:11351_t:CDS:2 [Entrophospora sp. SA101]